MSRVFVRKTLLKKIALLYFVMNGFSIAVYLMFLNSNQLELVTENTRFKAKAQISTVLNSIAYLEEVNREVLENTVSQLLPSYLILDQDGNKVWGPEQSPSSPKNSKAMVQKAITQSEYSKVDYYLNLHSTSFTLQFFIPLNKFGLKGQILYVPIHMQDAGKRFQHLQKLLLYGILILTFLHFVFALILSKMIVVPIQKLNSATGRVAEGNFDERVSISSHDEIGSLANGFNTMQQMLKKSFAKIQEEKEQIEKMAITDELSQLYNRRFLFDWLDKELARLDRYSEGTFGILLLDIDHFKKINDTYGHDVGDEAIKHVAHILKRDSRKADIVSRYGGEEFVVILPETDLQGSQKAAEYLRKVMESTPVDTGGDSSLSLTMSIGVSEYRTYKEYYGSAEVNGLLKSADNALYRAKESGRNQSCLFTELV